MSRVTLEETDEARRILESNEARYRELTSEMNRKVDAIIIARYAKLVQSPEPRRFPPGWRRFGR